MDLPGHGRSAHLPPGGFPFAQVEALVMIDMAGMPPRFSRSLSKQQLQTCLKHNYPTTRLTPGPVPTLGERLGTALRRSQSLEVI